MYKNILVPTDGSALSEKAVEHGVALAKAIGARVTFLTATEPFQIFSLAPELVEYTPDSYSDHVAKQASKVLNAAAKVANENDVRFEAVHIERDHPYQAIIEAAQSAECDLILMASHGRRGVSAMVLGSETVKVLTHSKIPVLVYR